MSKIISDIRKQLKGQGTKENRESSKRYFKEEIKVYGLKNPAVNKISRETYKWVKDKSKGEIFDLCEELWRSGYVEEAVIACNWVFRLKKSFTPEDFDVFDRWVGNYVTNWATCDTLCNHTVGTFLATYPEFLPKLPIWAKSENRWMRRAAAVSLIVPAKKGNFHDTVFQVADALLLDKDDLVQKGYGWMLKVSSQSDQQRVFDYVMSKKDVMPRTALRYAIEKMPPDLRAEAMKK